MDKQTGCVYLVGAGCGGVGLMTVRGLALLRRCDAVVYDDLIGTDILAEAPAGAERLYMGKRIGRHSAPQEQISRELIRLAQEGKTVVRLKGGDPYVFGRGGEEMLALQAAGIPCEEVPGITSAIAIPAAAGIPVTHRSVSRSVHIITGHTADTADGLPDDMDALARTGGTLVFLMGLGKLETIVQRLEAAGRNPETPAAVLSGGLSPDPAAVRGTLADIAARTRAAGVVSPAVIVVGETAAMDLRSTIARPLSGVRVGLVGTPAMTDQLKQMLEEQGAEPREMVRSTVDALPVEFPWQSLTDGNCHWITLTSANGVHLLFQHLRGQGVDLRRLDRCRFAVIGAATGRVLAQYGIQADLCPAVYTGKALGEELCRRVSGGEDVLLFRSARGSALLEGMLREAGIPCQDIPVYDFHPDEAISRSAAGHLKHLDYLVFSSGSGVDLFELVHGAIPDHVTCVCIGEVTAQALAARTDRPFLTAGEISARGIVNAIVRDHSVKRHGKGVCAFELL